MKSLCCDSMIIGYLGQDQWSPYFVGASIGVLNLLAFGLSDRPIGCSTAYSRISGMIERLFRGNIVEEKAYYKKFKPMVEWEGMLLAGVLIGAFISASLSGQFQIEAVPSVWDDRFGPDVTVRLISALFGGMIVGFGARLAGGCTSGHGISGTPQLALSSWVALVCFFLGGVITAMALFKLA